MAQGLEGKETIDKRRIVEAWLNDLCLELHRMVWDDHEFWPDGFKKQVEAAQELDLIDTDGWEFVWVIPEDSDVESLFEIAKASVDASFLKQEDEDADAQSE